MVSVECGCGTVVELAETKTVTKLESDDALMRVCSVRCPGCGLLHIHCTVDLEVYKRSGEPRLGFLDELMSYLMAD